ncbi:MAG: hypothetical protein EU536_02900 [Promethearchaeota archaeon]|nr:MAG: hypothetical protein EU536_02900 [Candidatus Lokiarchaeota archaeon]
MADKTENRKKDPVRKAKSSVKKNPAATLGETPDMTQSNGAEEKIQKGVIKQGTIAEFMRKRTQLVGFDLGFAKHTQYMAEFVDNSLDAIEIAYWQNPKIFKLKEDFYFEYPKPTESLRDVEINPPNILERIKNLLEPLRELLNSEPLLVIRIQDYEKPELLGDDQAGRELHMFSFECFDNGIGLVPSDLEKFGKYLASSKSERLKQTRGSQGFGASSAFSDSQNTTGRPVTVISRHEGERKATLTTFFTTSKNEKDYTIPPMEMQVPFKHGTYVMLNYLNVPYKRGAGSGDDYIEQTALLNSHISIVFINPRNEVSVYPRRVTKFPNEPKYAKPHPASSSIGDFKEMLRITDDDSIVTFLEQKFVRMSRERAKKIVEAANKELGGFKGIYSKKPSELNEKEVKTLVRVLNKQVPCLNRIAPADLKVLFSGMAPKPVADALAEQFPVLAKKEYAELLKELKLQKKNTNALTPEEIELIQNTSRERFQCPTAISFKAFKDLIDRSGEKTLYDILSTEFCKLNFNSIRKVVQDADNDLKYKTLHFLTGKDLNKREIEVLYDAFSQTVQTEEVKNLSDFKALLESGSNRTVSSLLQKVKGLGKSAAADILDKADQKLQYKSTLTMKAKEASNKEIKALYDRLMESGKCMAAVTPHTAGQLLEGATETNLSTFLHRNFMDVDTKIANQLVDEINESLGGHVSLENIRPKDLDEDQLNALYKAFISEKYLAPPTDTVVPVGAEILERVIKKHFSPQFVVAETRSPTSGKGLAFAVEVAIALGGKIKDTRRAADVLFRFVNRTPKLRDNSDCAIWKTVSRVNWKNYKIETFDNGIPKGKILIFANVSGPFVHVMFKSQSKQALADDEMLQREIQLALESVGRKIKMFLTGREARKRKARRALTLLKNVEKFASSLYKVECTDFKTGEHIPGKPTLTEIETQLSRPIKDDLRPDVKNALTDEWATITTVIEDLGLETLKDKFVKDLIVEVLEDLAKEYNLIVKATPQEILETFIHHQDPASETFILETLDKRVDKFLKCADCELSKEEGMCSHFNLDLEECPIEKEVFSSFTSYLKDSLNLDPVTDETLINFFGMTEVYIDRNRRLNKPIKNLVEQKSAFIKALEATPRGTSGIQRAASGIAQAFQDTLKQDKEDLFWRLIKPDIKSVLPADDFTFEHALKLTYPNVKGGTLTNPEDDFVKAQVQEALEELIDEGILMTAKKQGNLIYRHIIDQEVADDAESD